jgi:hypothetical protein
MDSVKITAYNGNIIETFDDGSVVIWNHDETEILDIMSVLPSKYSDEELDESLLDETDDEENQKTPICPSQEENHRNAKKGVSRMKYDDLQRWDFVDMECPSQEEEHRIAKKLRSRTIYERDSESTGQPVFAKCPSQKEAHRNAKRSRSHRFVEE